MKFEKGKTYRFSREKFASQFGEEMANRTDCWMDAVENTQFTIDKEMEDGEAVDISVLGAKMKYSVVPNWCEEVH